MTPIDRDHPHFGFLNSLFEGKTIEEFTLAGDASARKYFRMVVDEVTYVLMCWEPFSDVENYPFLNVLNHLSKHSGQVPKVIGMSPKEGLVLLEDLGDLTLERKFWESQNADDAFEYYKLAIDELSKIHYPCTKDHASKCVAFNIEFNTERLLWEMNHAREHLLEKFLQLRFDEHESLVLQKS